jgi:hypothetical protein
MASSGGSSISMTISRVVKLTNLVKHASKQHGKPCILLDLIFEFLDSGMNGFRVFVDMFNSLIQEFMMMSFILRKPTSSLPSVIS